MIDILLGLLIILFISLLSPHATPSILCITLIVVIFLLILGVTGLIIYDIWKDLDKCNKCIMVGLFIILCLASLVMFLGMNGLM